VSLILIGLVGGFVLGYVAARVRVRVGARRSELRKWWRMRFGDYAHEARRALPDGTRVRLVCKNTRCGFHDHEGIWITSWTPRRNGDPDDPDDYRLTREGDGETAFAVRSALEVVP
jgi:hypothetical protein